MRHNYFRQPNTILVLEQRIGTRIAGSVGDPFRRVGVVSIILPCPLFINNQQSRSLGFLRGKAGRCLPSRYSDTPNRRYVFP
jgi:hypothetical protein